MDLLAKPMQKLPLVILVDGLFLMGLGLVIIALHLQEKSDDQKEKEAVTAFDYF